MTKIHMETEEVRMVARMLNQKIDELLDHEHRLKRAAGKASSAWYGGSKPTRYHKNLKNWLNSFENQINQLETLTLRLSHEVDQWEQTDLNSEWGAFKKQMQSNAFLPMSALTGAAIFSAVKNYAPGNISVMNTGTPSTPPEKPSWFAEHFTWGAGAGIEGSYKSKHGKANWHKREKYDYKVEAKAGFQGAVSEGKYHSWGKWEVGAKGGLGKKGWSAGLYAEGSVFEAQRSKVFGSSMFGLTLTGGVSVGSVEGFAGLKDNHIGASIGGSLAAGEVGIGLNILGANVQIAGGAAAGLQAGIKFGAKNEAKLGPFKLGLNFGQAITE